MMTLMWTSKVSPERNIKMKLNTKILKKLILEELNMLLEQDEEGEGLLGVEEEPEEEPEEETEEEPEEETEEETEEVSAEEEKVLVKTADDQVQHMLVDFESEAIKSAQLQKDELPMQQEVWYRCSLSQLLFEQETHAPDELPSSDIDLQSFAGNVARLIMNYDSLLDMEMLIIDKAKTFLEDKYDEATAMEFENILNDQFHITLEPYVDEQEMEAPLAIGAGGSVAV